MKSFLLKHWNFNSGFSLPETGSGSRCCNKILGSDHRHSIRPLTWNSLAEVPVLLVRDLALPAISWSNMDSPLDRGVPK